MLIEPRRKCGVQKMDESNNLSRSFRFRFVEQIYCIYYSVFALRDKGTSYLYHIRGVRVANK